MTLWLTPVELRELPSEGRGCHVYFLWRGDELLYVGGTKAITSRMTMHDFAKGSPPWVESYGVKVPYERVTMLGCERTEMRRLEREYIARLKPPFNKQGNKERA